MDNTATKDDIKKLADKFVAKVATKAELKQVEKNLRGEILRVEVKVEDVEKRVRGVEKELKELREEVHEIHIENGKLNEKLDKLQNTLDAFVGVVDELRTENEVGSHQIRELDKRVTKLESSSHAE